MTFHADLRQVIYALSDALDLVGVDDVSHGKRVGVMAAECAKALKLPQDERLFLFDLGILHDIGVSTTTTHQHLVSEFDWAGSQDHALLGHALLKDFAPLARMALPIRYHHTRWDQLTRDGISPEVAMPANLIFLVDRVDALMAPFYASGKVLQHHKTIQQQILAHRGSYFDPRLVDVFFTISSHEAFWLLLEPKALSGYMADMVGLGKPYQATKTDLRQLAEIFARIVDAKSPFTLTHSRGVARVAKALAQRMGLAEGQCDKLEIAGLLHDLGKLRVPDNILDKPSRLDEDERSVMNAHSFQTMQILRNIQGFEDIRLWAASHHEAPGGLGYPYGLEGADLPLEARILRVADIFQAMVQDRPYRKGLSAQAASVFMADLMLRGSIDAQIGQVLQDHLDDMFAAARPEPVLVV
ncbi:HD domain-containing protein [Rhodoferax sp. 4810]|nr:HD domain-containing protein [Rhodoferax jenense]